MTEITKKPILLVGASLTKQHAEFRDGVNTVFPFSVNAGSYVSLEGALWRKDFIVMNMGIGGSAVFDYDTDLFGYADTVSGFQTQLDRALLMVTTPGGEINADYGVIVWGNEHLHGLITPNPSTIDDINATTDTYIALGQQLLDAGVTPIFSKYPAWGVMDISGFLAFGAPWVIDQTTWELLATTYETRIAAELPDALIVGMWDNYTNLGDGVHPDEESAMTAAIAIERAIDDHED